MADDIDIEEHDVLESLRRRQMPAVVVKQEPVDEDYTESHYEPDSEYSQSQWAWESQEIDPALIKVEKPDEPESDIPFGKIILGSKPPDATEEIQPLETGDGENKEVDRQENYNYNMSLVLEDWGPILEDSNCYCPECQTLFATVNALDAHKMIAHSFLIAMDKEDSPERNKAIKSTAKPDNLGATCEICKFTFKGGKTGRFNLMRHYRNVHQIDPLQLKSEGELKNWKICNHCNVYFPSDTALVKHLYELLPLNDNKAKDDKPSPVKVQSPVKTVPTASKVDTTPVPKPFVVKTVKQTPKQANSLILGSKINGVKVDNTTDNAATTNPRVRKCEVCGIEYSRKYYIKHMKKFHPEILLMKMNRLKKLHPINVSTNVRYKCSECQATFDGPTSARKHRAQKHPDMKGRRMFLKIVKTSKIQKVKVKPKILKLKKHMQCEDNDLVVSKSTLFKCNRCSVHFLTCYGACAHSRVCETSSNHRDWSCLQCQKVFKYADKKAHQFQHQAANGKFKVYVVYLEMVVRILCECPYCYVCFEEYKFWRHIKFGCEKDTESFFCNECRLPIDTSSKTSHESKHTQGDFTKEDFIKIDCISSNKGVKEKAEPEEKYIPVPTLKRKLMPSDAPQKVPRHVDRMILLYCPACKSHLSRKTKEHVSGECKNYKSFQRKISCKFCGISFTAHSSAPHLSLHRKYPNLTLSDLTFIRITDNKKIRPIPDYHPCKKCHINFLTKLSRSMHDCGKTKSFNCQVCQKKIDKSSFKIHMRFHNYAFPGKVKTALKTLQGNAKASPLHRESEVKSPTKLKRNEPNTLTESGLPELLMKYQSLTTLWNILYVCETCDTFTDSYDKVVEHCQNHFINMESYGVVIMKCQICNMKFDRDCYRRHLELHAGSTDISRKSFKILRYDHAKLFSAEWLNFIELPEDQKTQILSRSMYGDKSYVRMKLEQQGPPEHTLYRCKLCLKCISPEAIIHHMSLTNCLKANKIVCPLCSIVFASRTTFGQHRKLHKTTHMEADSFRIVAFNDSMDADLNKKILSEYNVGEVLVTEDPKRPDFFAKYPDNVKLVKGNKFYMFYKCVDCEVSTLDSNTTDHVCTTAKKLCPRCGLSFASNNFNEHTELHEEIAFSDKNVFTRAFYGKSVEKESKSNDTSKPVEKRNEATLYKCHCGLHFTSLKTIEKHYQNKNCSSVVREKCSHCYLSFDPNEIVNHLCKHHAQTQFQSFNIVVPNKKTLFKCKQCHVLFYDKRIGVVHSAKCDGVPNGTRCDACGLAFDKLSIKTHKDEHKLSGKAKLDCYIVENIQNYSNIDNTVLYKCKKCNVHYLEPSSARNHVSVYNHQMIQVKKCDQCSLRFTVKTLPRHVELHHNLLKIDRFRIKCIPDPNSNDSADKPSVSKVKESNAKESSKILNDGETHKIYRCKKCKLNFTDGKTLLKHNEDRCSKELVEVCEFCSFKFSAKNIKNHYKQHNGEEFINMDVTEDNDATKEIEDDGESRKGIDWNLYRCVTCELHFNLKKSWVRHMDVGCQYTKGPTAKCDECDVSFTRISFLRHKSLHDRYKLRKGDFNIIDLSGPIRGDEPEHSGDDENDTVTEGDGDNRNGDLNIYRCKYCSYHFNLKDSCFRHIRNGCGSTKGPPAKCDECDIAFTKISVARHKSLHENYKLKKGDFNIIDVPDPTKDGVEGNGLDIINDTVTEDDEERRSDIDLNLYRCKHCGFHFNMKRSCQAHISYGCDKTKGPSVKCDECGVSFTKISALRHSILHDKYNLNKDDFNIIVLSDSKKDGVKDYDGDDQNDTVTEDDAESRNDFNLYRCKTCGLHFNAKRYCLQHADGCDKTKGSPVKCDECEISFTKKSAPLHLTLHEIHNLKKGDFNIIDVSVPTKDEVTDTDGDDANDTVTEDDGESRNDVDLNVYRCKYCDYHFNKKNTLLRHIGDGCEKIKGPPVKCDECGINFTKRSALPHMTLHEKYNLKKDDFNIIGRSDPTKDDVGGNGVDNINDSLTEDDEERHTRSDSELNLYRCKYCGFHFNLKKSCISHIAYGCDKTKGPPVKCNECGISFSKISAMRHSVTHDKYNLKKGDFNIIDVSGPRKDDLTDNDDDANDTVTEDDGESRNGVDINLYRCKYCDYHFNSKSSLLKHINKGCETVKRPVKCDECNVNFTKNSATRHSIMHDKYNLKKDDFNIIQLPDSDGVELDPVGFVDDNSQSTNDNDTASLDSNLEATGRQVDDSKMNADLEETSTIDTNSTVEAETSQETELSQMKTKAKLKVYKCGDCNVYFMAQKTCYKHVLKHTPLDPKDYIECKLCGFQFIIAALQTHVKKHHAEEFKLEDVLVQEYHPSVLKNNLPEMEIYNAIDKEQSSLVSTSSDVNNVPKAIDTTAIDNEYNKSETLAVDSTEVIISSNCSEFSEKIDALDKT